jgi:ABC-type uncharacterized transport system substrate-binding protein
MDRFILFLSIISFIFSCRSLPESYYKNLSGQSQIVIISQDFGFLDEIVMGLSISLGVNGHNHTGKISQITLSRNYRTLKFQLDEVIRLINKNPNVRMVVLVGPHVAHRFLIEQDILRKNIKIIYSGVPFPQHRDAIKNNNLSGIALTAGYEPFYKILSQIKISKPWKLAIFYSSSLNQKALQETKSLEKKYNIQTQRFKVNEEEFYQNLYSLDDDINAFYLAMDPLYDLEKFNYLTDYCKDRKIILFSDFRVLTHSGAFMSFSPNYYQVGLQTGLLLTEIMKRKIPPVKKDGIPIREVKPIQKLPPIREVPSENHIRINHHLAQKFKIKIPPALKMLEKSSLLYKDGIKYLSRGELCEARNSFLALEKIRKNGVSKYFIQYSDLKTVCPSVSL